MTGSMRPMWLFSTDSLSAACTARRDAEERAAGEVSVPKKSVVGSKVSVTWVSWRGNARRGPRARAATAPLIRAECIVESCRSAGREGPSSSLEDVGTRMVIAFPSRVTVYSVSFIGS
jgi:hypothetical protein